MVLVSPKGSPTLPLSAVVVGSGARELRDVLRITLATEQQVGANRRASLSSVRLLGDGCREALL
jgi:hypothetical protein